MLLFGVMIFTSMMGKLIDQLNQFKRTTQEDDDESQTLVYFFGVMRKFNGNKNLNEKLIHDFEHYFVHYWDNNPAMTVQFEWYQLVMQLDQEHKHKLLCNFLYMEVRKVFSRFLTIPNSYS